MSTLTNRIIRYLRNNYKPLLFLFLTWGIYFIVMWTKMLYFDTDGNLVAGWRIIWADWAMHIGQTLDIYHNNIIEVLVNHPLYDGIPLRYSFIANLISAILMRLGLGIVQATIIPSIIFSFLLLFGLYFFLSQITYNKRQVVLAIFLFLLSGGLGFYHFITDLSSNFSFSYFIFPPSEYTRIESLGYYWYTSLNATIIPQRAFLLGMAVTLFILGLLYRYYSQNFKVKEIKTRLIILGILSGLLTFIHFHSLVLLFLICAFLFIFDLKNYKHWLIYSVSTLVAALPFIIFFQPFSSGSFVRFYPGWLAKSIDMPILIFWIKNWGILIPLTLISLFFFAPRNHKKKNIFILSFFWIFILCNLFLFQPYDWDNSKLLLWSYLIFSLITSQLILKLWSYKRLKLQKFTWNRKQENISNTYVLPELLTSAVFKSLAVILFIFLTLSGYLDVVNILNTKKNSFIMLTKEELDLADQYRAISNYDDLALISNNHLHWLPVASARRVFMGYNGWIWSWGIDYGKRHEEIKKMYQNTKKGRDLLRENQINYVVIDNQAKKEYWADTRYFDENYEKLINSGQYSVYKIN
jgi:hypothetical protein